MSIEMGLLGLLYVSTVVAPSARDVRGAFEAVDPEPQAKLVEDPPLPGPLSQGRVVIQYWAEHLLMVRVFGIGALDVSPRIGHIHVTVDDASWADASGEPLAMNGFERGTHEVLIELVDANHKRITQQTLQFEIP